MKRIVGITFVIVFTLIVTNTRSVASKYALIIGNSDYKNAPLSTPSHDARSMAKTLLQLGFQVTTEINATQHAMNRAIQTFAQQLSPQSMAVFYFSGHGIQVDGINYLLPIDIQKPSRDMLEKQAIAANHILDIFDQAQTRLNIIILDACRNNPFPLVKSEQSTQDVKLSGFPTEPVITLDGLAHMEAPTGTLIAYATAPGTVAYEGDALHSIYTKNLLNIIQIPGLQVEDVFKRVRQFVMMETENQQVPWESSSLIGDMYFLPPSQRTTQRTRTTSSTLHSSATLPSSGQKPSTKRSSSDGQQPHIKMTTNKSVYYEGDRVVVILQTTTDCYIKLYNMTADQHVHMVFPNEWNHDNFIRGGQRRILPSSSDTFEFIVEAPYGTERLWVEASTRQFQDLQDTNWQGTGFLYHGQFPLAYFRVSKTQNAPQGTSLFEVTYSVLPRE